MASLCIGSESGNYQQETITYITYCGFRITELLAGRNPGYLEVRNNKELRALGNEGYTIQTSKGGSQITIASSGEQGVLYGTYHLLRLQATGQLPESALQSLISPNDLIIEFVS